MAAAPRSLHMSPSDLIVKRPLDYGGFGEVYLCYHVTLGHVVLKTMYTGPLRSQESRRSLMAEGTIMASLDHRRVVKLLGVIMEERECSLVMELIPRGNLLVLLESMDVPVSIKGRIILEILEGMAYLTEKRVIHKDVKPENILVDKDFHIKIADLGLATYQTWSKLTRQESRKKSRPPPSAGGAGPGAARGAGTLSYMAPEHLESIHTVSTEKSDVYSFAIVVWVVLTGEEPYANARSDEQISQCVRNGDRPAEDLIPAETPQEIIDLMKRCWTRQPHQRPTFQECFDSFRPFYEETLEPYVEEDVLLLKTSCEDQDDLVEKPKSLSVTQESFSASGHDSPAPLVSSDRSESVPVEASIEDLHRVHYPASAGCIQSDALGTGDASVLEEKLGREFQYHKNGLYSSECQLDAANANGYRPSYPSPSLRSSDFSARHPEMEKSSVHSWTKAELVQPSSQEEALYRPTAGLYESMNSSQPVSTPLPGSASAPSLSRFNQQHPFSHLDRQQSWPAVHPVSDTSAPDVNAGRLLTPKCSSLQDPASLYIQNASGIQIGSHNILSIQGCDSSSSLLSLPNGLANSPIREALQKYEDRAVTEEHLDLLRDNIGSEWKRCARRLGLSTVEIETVEHDYQRDGLPEMVHQTLERWKRKEGCLGCTVGKLCRAVDGVIAVHVVQKILDTCQAADKTP